MLWAQRLFQNRQRPVIKELGLRVTTTLPQVKASLVEQSRTLGKLEAKLVDKFTAGLRLRKKSFADRPSRKLYVRKCEVYSSHRAFRRQALRDLVHALLQKSLNKAVDLKGVGVRISMNQGILLKLFNRTIQHKCVRFRPFEFRPEFRGALAKQFLWDHIGVQK